MILRKVHTQEALVKSANPNLSQWHAMNESLL